MQKKLIALAVAGLMSAPVMAQSNVTIFGVVDANVTVAKQGDNQFRGVENGGLSASRLGFKGSEDLGNGLKAVFHLEYGTNTATGAGPTGARQSWVGLDGGFGFVGLGRQYSPGHNISGKLDPFSSSAALSPILLIQGAAGATIQGSGNGRWNNAINYKSRSFSGLKFEAIYAFGENADQADDFDNRDKDTKFGLGAMYSNGPLAGGVAYHHTEGGAADDKKEWFVGGSYDAGVVDVTASYQQIKVGSSKNKVYSVSGAIPVSEAGKVLVGFAKLSHDNGDFDANALTVAYTHSLSKRTTGYVGYRRVSNDDASDVNSQGGLGDALVAQPGDTSSGVVVGVRHTF